MWLGKNFPSAKQVGWRVSLSQYRKPFPFEISYIWKPGTSFVHATQKQDENSAHMVTEITIFIIYSSWCISDQ